MHNHKSERRGRGGRDCDPRHGPHHGRGRRQRVLDGNQLRLLLLTLITEQERHGYDLIREIEARSGGAYAPSPGVIYPTLTMLLDMELLAEQEISGTRKLFGITDAGKAFLAENEQEAEEVIGRITALADQQERLAPAPVRRAMENLKTALQNRLAEDDVDKDTIFSIAALVDDASSKIERL